MKRAIIAIASVLLVVSITCIASAETVNIGVAAIDKSDQIDIRDRVAGVRATGQTVTVRTAGADIGVIDIDAAENAAIRDYVSGRKEIQVRTGKTPADKKAGIGIVDISRQDQQDIEKLTSWIKVGNPGQKLLERLHAGR